MNRVTVVDLKKKKENKEPIVMITAYDYPSAQMVDEAGVDIILVGDSLGMVVLGYENTLPVTMEDMLRHTAAVVRGAKRAMVVGDMPFMSYQLSPEQALDNAGRFIKEAGAHAVKLEGGEEVLETIKKITDAGIPVMGHIGLTPQSIHRIGGYRVQGRDDETALKLKKDAKLLEEAGCFSIVLEAVPTQLAKEITESLSIPTIGIGAGPYCDGQVLVYHDVLGIFQEFKPKFVKRYANLRSQIVDAVKQYVDEVRDRVFPDEEHSYS
ncbi:3-methyl-2-oxobutanoate hydroxymethyltransferase [Thermosulfidibacter takaii ABI70S6]|uniref:3-methyl-2-oxobutanoate hydroxymethyltransferase n=1 Tax=Thermosulfidibacter takaii (strain DSM 17441 / JCM 13301 / NBRC 103674 / ABI70S6) TaxID=1298851 RepID=A0A0S3QSR0_THET7|nr:3-methyl-2-oxobutanoate hydroxymethyltransferase [Thermosulfidibacter takaii]BAT71382.1 3-methyl-2-oxobutanoate hydroxymethyltransferase [Thermosulfidibacter takaii ABI70S6]